MLDAVETIAAQGTAWSADYEYSPRSNEYEHRAAADGLRARVDEWFTDSIGAQRRNRPGRRCGSPRA